MLRFRWPVICLPLLWLSLLGPAAGADTGPTAARFTALVAAPTPTVVHSAPAFAGGRYEVGNILIEAGAGGPRREYASAGKGTGTFIDFDLGQPRSIAGFRHVDRRDPATVDAAELIFSDQPDFKRVVKTIPIDHVNRAGGTTFVHFDPVTARYIRWQVTAIDKHTAVGGAEITFFTATAAEAAPTRTTIEVTAFPALLKAAGGPLRLLRVGVDYPYAEPAEAVLRLPGGGTKKLELHFGKRVVELAVPAVETEQLARITLDVGSVTVARAEVLVKPVRHWEMVLLPHSHVDIGYTQVQTEVERKQWQHFKQAIELARATADYPAGAQFKWNSEGLWAVDSYLKQATADEREKFLDAVRRGQLHLDGLYGNELTGLCRPEELFQLTACARRLRRQYRVPIDAAMISDVPGYTWGLVPVLAQSGIKYLSIGPNPWHRIGRTLQAWGDRPFYWVSPSGKEKVLCWMAGKSYAWFHAGLLGRISKIKPDALFAYLTELAGEGYPYDMVQVRYTVGGDNGPPDPDLPKFVKDWNARYAVPKLTIATTHELFTQFERRYGPSVPEVHGDFTPYWEDGAASSARETGINRRAAERLVQAETLWAMLHPQQYPEDDFRAAWRNVVLYDEHTWGAHCSISKPDSQFTRSQWKIKQAFALEGDRQSRALQDAATGGRAHKADMAPMVQVLNTSSWSRTDLVVLPAECTAVGDRVTGPDGQVVPSQRLASGQLAFRAADVPPFGAKRYTIGPGAGAAAGSARAEGVRLANASLSVVLDKTTGAIAELRAGGVPMNLVDGKAGLGLNDFFYVAGRDPGSPERNGPVQIRVQDHGPLVASLVVTGQAPGCRQLTREIRLVDGSDHVDIINTLDKLQVRTPEGVHFGYALNVPEGVVRVETPWAVVRPEVDQLPGACRNYFTVQRWLDVSNNDFGVTWATVDAPMVELGAITMDIVPDKNNADYWIERLAPTQTFYSYVMNNYWETNYKASQQGPTTFHYSIRPHAGSYQAAPAARFGLERSQPLVAVPATGSTPPVLSPRLRVASDDVIVTAFRPSRDSQALVVRLFGAGGRPSKAALTWGPPQPKTVSISGPDEEKGPEINGPVDVPAWGIVTVRAELPE